MHFDINLLAATAIGVVCGYLNSMGSGGPAFAIPMLLWLGIPIHVANGSNRIGLIAGGLARIVVFHRAGRIRWREWRPVILPAMLGALVGASLEWRIPGDTLRQIIPLVLLGSLTLLLFGTSRFLRSDASAEVRIRPVHLVLAGFIGVWNGMLAIEAAVLYLILFVMGPRLPLADANVLKAICVFGGAVSAALIFAGHAEISWPLAGALACGNLAGAHLGAHHALKPAAQRWVFRLLIVALALELLGFLRIYWDEEVLRQFR